jgi:hypothetical protein
MGAVDFLVFAAARAGRHPVCCHGVHCVCVRSAERRVAGVSDGADGVGQMVRCGTCYGVEHRRVAVGACTFFPGLRVVRFRVVGRAMKEAAATEM